MRSLEGLTVLDLTRVLAGPFCTQILSDLGAVVWKIEPPWGDDTRRWGPPYAEGESAYYLSANRGKKSIAVNLKSGRGQAVVRELALRADVLVENFKPGDLARAGLDYDGLAPLNPGLVYASITGFGHDGPRADEPGYDLALQGMTGIMSVTGEPGGPPVRIGVAWIDVLTGLVAAVGILAALRDRDRRGQGQHLDLSLFDVGLMCMANQAQGYLLSGEPPGRLGSAHPQIVPYQAFQALDGWFILAVGNDAQYHKMVEAIGQPGLGADARFKTNADRVRTREALVEALAIVFAARPREEWLRALKAAGVPAAPVWDLREAFADPHARARDVIWNVGHPTLGEIPLVANALQHMRGTPAAPGAHPPLLGEHTRAILAEVLAMPPEEIASLEAEGAILTRP
ncbi:MAG: CoA transferase [Armatimonadetes bacterium]|nr:CoA transferase [Armatimonadota bacterium]